MTGRGFGFGAAVVAGALFGIGGTFGEFLFQHRGVGVAWLVTVRMLASGLVLLQACAARDPAKSWAPWRSRSDAVALILFGIIGMLGVQYTYFAAIADSNTATATVLQYTSPVMIALWLTAQGKRRASFSEAAAVALALAGTFVAVTHGDPRSLRISVPALIWGLASALTAAFYSLQPAGLLKRYGASLVTGWGMAIGGLVLAVLHPPWLVAGTWDATALLFMGFIIVFGTLLAFYLYMEATRLVGAQRTSLLACAEPLSAAALAVWWLRVPWTAMDWLGTAMILATIVLLARDNEVAS